MDNLYDMFATVCNNMGDSIALIYDQKHITYKTLFFNVEKIYNILINHGIKRGDIIGLYLKRSPNVFSSMLAILKLGATYMPLNLLQPTAELQRMMDETGSNLVLIDQSTSIPFLNYLYIELDEFDYNIDLSIPFHCTYENHLKKLAYIMYTSGSTGKAKGVGIRQESLYNLILNGSKEIGLKEGQRIISLSNYAFDMSIPETIMPICIGMSIVIVDDNDVLNPRMIRKLIQNYEVSVLLITPTRMNVLLSCKSGMDFLQNIRYILFGAEMIPLTLLNKLREATSAQIFNLYGPTETTAYLTYSNITNKKIIDIGAAIANTKLLLVDANNKVIHGEGEGEILITGIGVANGYLTSSDNNSFCLIPEISDTVVYFTGDYGKRLNSGEILYIGRCDNQIKYRGYRLGIEEIENKILNHAKEIQNCAVLVLKDDIDEYLTLVYVSTSKIDISSFKTMMKEYLPLYSIPNNFIRVETLPLNKNSKIDRIALSCFLNNIIPIKPSKGEEN